MLNMPPVHKWDGDVSALFLSPDRQIRAWSQFIEKRGYHTGQQSLALTAIPPAPVLSDKDKKYGFHSVCLFYGFGAPEDNPDSPVSTAYSALFGWEEITRLDQIGVWSILRE